MNVEIFLYFQKLHLYIKITCLSPCVNCIVVAKIRQQLEANITSACSDKTYSHTESPSFSHLFCLVKVKLYSCNFASYNL